MVKVLRTVCPICGAYHNATKKKQKKNVRDNRTKNNTLARAQSLNGRRSKKHVLNKQMAQGRALVQA